MSSASISGSGVGLDPVVVRRAACGSSWRVAGRQVLPSHCYHCTEGKDRDSQQAHGPPKDQLEHLQSHWIRLESDQ